MSPAAAERRKPRSNAGREQLLFSFADQPVDTKRIKLRRRKQGTRPAAPAQSKPAAQNSTAKEESITQLCVLLHHLAQKYVSRSNFQDRDTLVQCTKILQEFGLSFDVVADLKAPVESYNSAVVTHAPQYRLLRSRAMAALATIADFSGKAPAKGSVEYQKGMRDGFEYASDVAIFFLEDLEAAFPGRK